MSDAMPDGYDFMEALSADPVFRVTRAAVTGEMGRLCVLRLLYPSASPTSRRALRAYAARFDGFKSPLLNAPMAALECPDGSLALRYAHRPPTLPERAATLPPLDAATLARAARLCSDLADALTALHGCDVRHGCLTPESVWLSDDAVRVDVPGYAALLEAGDPVARGFLSPSLAPEVREGGRVTVVADVFGYAGVIAAWLPEVRDTPWHRQATDPDPSRRFGSTAEALPGLLRLLETCATEPPTVERRPTPPAPVPKVPGEPVARPLSFVRLDPGSPPVTGGEVAPGAAPTPERASGGEVFADARVLPGLPDLRDDAAPHWLLGALLAITVVLAVLALSLAPVMTRLLGP